MAGHSQFKNIMYRKGAQDAKRARMFTKLAREITVAARTGIPDPASNPRLRAAILAGRAVNMPNNNIERAIKRATAAGEAESLEEIRYEGFGPGGVAIIVEALTDNRNRTASDVRTAFNRYGGNMGETGSVAYMFDRRGFITVDASQIEEDDLMELVLEAGGDDLRSEGDVYEIYTEPEAFEAVKSALEARELEIGVAEITMLPQNTVEVEGKKAEQVLKLLEALDDHDDVTRAYANFDISEEEMAELAQD